ncbi:hypothetical protein N7462_008571 [Penicillium macrosclerotiorum]|uniref:uncharacterized protein n=1 Tax=Penicillium macrosclerotiorum TaxID=303699 RepID=UPI0025469126|nr:uncharacterized protein N7462_008571 [Penicillium macrosclerotiorum]KAJ5675674.1 hypothetical protein N7462_008571 [Penicillium macrosclerotiorum]
MKLLTSSLSLLLATLTSTIAAPVTQSQPFDLITSGASNSSRNNLYLSTQATDPLNSNAVFRDAADAASFSYVASNGTVRYAAPNGAPYALALVEGKAVKADVEVSVSPSSGSTGFRLQSGHLVSSNAAWGGWLVCPGDTELLGLFYVDQDAGTGVPSGCDEVQLDVAYTNTSS